MKKELRFYYFGFLFFLMSYTAYSQWKNDLWTEKQAYNWHFGFAAGINFNTVPPVAITDSSIGPDFIIPNDHSSMKFIEGTGAISDIDGNSLFYTNGETVWNANNLIMENGMGLLGSVNSTQSSMIVPSISNPNLYYLFSVDGTGSESKVVYSEIDMTLDGGLGAITSTKNVELATGVVEKISATHHANGKDVWVVIHSSESNEFKSFLVSETGVNITPVTSNAGILIPGANLGAMKISPDGTTIATTNMFVSLYKIELFNFSKESGTVTGLFATLNATDMPGELFGCYGIEFSPNSKLLYASTVITGRIFQFDLSTGNEAEIKASTTIIGTSITDDNFSMQLAPDGKIYVAHGYYLIPPPPSDPYVGTQSTLNVIEFPNNLGEASGFTEGAVDLINGRNDVSLPTFIQSYFASGILHEGQCASQEIVFSTLRIPDITEISWDFGDPASGEANISSEGHHVFNSAGTYTVTATITSNNAQQIATAEVTIVDVPIAVTPITDLTKCADNSGKATFDLSEFNDTILDGQNASDFSVSYFANQDDLVANSPIESPNIFITSGQIVYAQVLNEETGCFRDIQFELIVNPLPIASKPANIQECATNNREGAFNLISQNAIILGDQEDFEVTYFVNVDDAQQGENPITDADNFSSSGQTIYAVVTNPETGCNAITQFELIVLDAPVLANGLEFTGCAPFDLEIITAEVGIGFTLKYYTTEEDALNRTNAINNFNQFVFTGNEVTIYILAENQEGCTAIALLQLYKDSCEIQKGISPNGDGKNDFFDLSGFDVKELSVFNRYGIEVYAKSNYTNEWSGQTNKGDELPTGTYYYMMKSNDGKNQTGWVYINRQE